VKVTRDIFQFGLKHGYVRIQRSEAPDAPITEVAVQWN